MDAGEWTWPRWFTTLATARELVAHFCEPDPATVILGIAVAETTARDLELSLVPGRTALEPGGHALGHELLGAYDAAQA